MSDGSRRILGAAALGLAAGGLHASLMLAAEARAHAPEPSWTAVRLGLSRPELALGLALGLVQGALLGVLLGAVLALRRRPLRPGRHLPLLGALRAGLTVAVNAVWAAAGLWALLAVFPNLAPARALPMLAGLALAETGLLALAAALARRWRRAGPLLAGAGLAAAGAAIGLAPLDSPPPAARPGVRAAGPAPDVVLVVWDACRADALGAYGFPGGSTPLLDALSRRGITFAAAVAPASWTLPSHASLFTGVPPAGHQAHNEHPFLGPEPATLAELLAGAGFRTTAVSSNAYVSRAFGLARGFTEFHETWAAAKNRPDQTMLGRWRSLLADRRRDRDYRDNGAAVTAERLSTSIDGRAEPLFLFLNYMETHLPARLPDPYGRLFTEGGAAVPEGTELQLFLAYLHGSMPERLTGAFLAKHWGGARYLDGELARLLALLEERRPGRPRLLVLASDHGENAGEAGEFGHNLVLSEPLLHVHLILVGPGVPAGLLVDRPVSLGAVATTVLGLAGVAWDGAGTLQPGLFAPAAPPPVAELYHPGSAVALYESLAGTARIDWDGSRYLTRRRALYLPGLKLARTEDGPAVWYDLAADPAGLAPVAGPAPAEAAAALDAWEARWAGATLRGERPTLDHETEERLRALGYIE